MLCLNAYKYSFNGFPLCRNTIKKPSLKRLMNIDKRGKWTGLCQSCLMLKFMASCIFCKRTFRVKKKHNCTQKIYGEIPRIKIKK